MAKGITVQVQGMDLLRKRFGKDIPKYLTDEIDAELSAVSNDAVTRAASDAPVNYGNLKNQITFQKIGDMKYEVVSGAEYSAFIEFGTKTRVQVPADLQAYAAQFRNSSSGGDAKKAIYEWCKAKGIEEKYWYPIFIKIMTVGINPHPFFFKQMDWARAELNRQLKQVIKEAIKR